MPGRLPEIERQLSAVPLGWYRGVLVYALERRLGQQDEAEDQLVSIESEANHYLVRVYLLEFTYLAILLLGGIVLFVLATLVGTGVLKRLPADLHPVAAPVLRSFLARRANGQRNLIRRSPRIGGASQDLPREQQ